MRTPGSARELEVRRRIAGKLLLRGMGVSEVAKVVEASTSAVSRWKQMISREGLEGLKAKSHPGRPPKLSTAQLKQLVEMLQRGPVAAGFPTAAWTCPRVAEVIENQFGVCYHVDHIWRLLNRLGWSCQMPEQRARERDEETIACWRQEEWPRIKKGSKAKS